MPSCAMGFGFFFKINDKGSVIVGRRTARQVRKRVVTVLSAHVLL